MGSTRIRVMYVVPDLGVGGAERHVTKLMPNLDRSKFDTAVVCIGNEGSFSARSRPPMFGRSHCIAVSGKRSARWAISCVRCETSPPMW